MVTQQHISFDLSNYRNISSGNSLVSLKINRVPIRGKKWQIKYISFEIKYLAYKFNFPPEVLVPKLQPKIAF